MCIGDNLWLEINSAFTNKESQNFLCISEVYIYTHTHSHMMLNDGDTF